MHTVVLLFFAQWFHLSNYDLFLFQSFGFYVLLTELPTYMKNVLHFDMKVVIIIILHFDMKVVIIIFHFAFP